MLKKLTLIFFTLTLAFRCDFYDLEINVDPNNPLSTTTDLLLPSIQINWASDYQYFHDVSGGIMGHTSNSDGLSFSQTSFDGIWNSVYLSEGADLDEYLKSAALRNEAGQYLTPGALGIGEVMKAFIFTTMVDFFGDVPYSESSLGNDIANVNPVYDDQEAIYLDCLALLDSAVVHFAASSSDPEGDLIYGGNMASWTKAANSLKLKVLMNARYKADFTYGSGVSNEIDLLFADAANLLITENSENFEFQYNTNQCGRAAAEHEGTVRPVGGGECGSQPIPQAAPRRSNGRAARRAILQAYPADERSRAPARHARPGTSAMAVAMQGQRSPQYRRLRRSTDRLRQGVRRPNADVQECSSHRHVGGRHGGQGSVTSPGCSGVGLENCTAAGVRPLDLQRAERRPETAHRDYGS